MIHIFWGALLLLTPALSSGEAKICPHPKQYKDILECALDNGTEIQRARLHERGLESGLFNVPRLNNPEFEIETVNKETEISLTQSLDLGGKRRALLNKAQAQLLLSKKETEDLSGNVRIDTFVKLHRLRQIDIERNVVNRIADAIGRSVSFLKSRPALSPEQNASLLIYQMALADSKIKSAESREEEIQLEKYFQLLGDYSIEVIKKTLPLAPFSFPQISEHSSSIKTFAVSKFEAAKDLALSDLAAEKAGAWSDLRVGPVFKLDKSEGKNEKSFGIKLSFDLPFFDRNQTGTAIAATSFSQSQTLMELGLLEERAERAALLKSYQISLSTLKEVPSIAETIKMIEKIEYFEKRGLVSSALLIESYRQQLEIIKGRHGRELAALESLLKINKIDGKRIEEII